MPTYEYRCTECGRELEVVQKFSDPSLTECPACSGALRKVFNAVGVVFKGSGFYRNDSRSSTNGEKKSDSADTDAKPAEKTTEKTPDSKPAKDEPGKSDKVGASASSSSTGAKAASS
ncbi:MAG: FmdB family transcriptional regulator [Propionibacteriaceae bacterium]|nr:FmdB family transcriptional regulator [Propionibacteriaceae bacterium]